MLPAPGAGERRDPSDMVGQGRGRRSSRSSPRTSDDARRGRMGYQEDEEPMDVPAVLAALDKALSMLYRSALQYTVVSGSLFGLQYLALGTELRAYGEAELADTRFVVEKIAALGGSPTTAVTPFDWSGDPEEAVGLILASEKEAIDALRAVIPHTGTEGRSEALERRHPLGRRTRRPVRRHRARRP